MPIIAFIPSVNLDAEFPIGFSENGDMDGDGIALILLDDDNFADHQVGGTGPALVIQHHNTSQQVHKAQIATLAEWGWEPTLIEKFSRVEDSFPFWQDVLTLLDKTTTSDVKATVIIRMQERYGNAYKLSMLDDFCAWRVLNIVAPEDEQIINQFNDQYDRLPDEIKSEIDAGGQDNIFDSANIIAVKLMV